MLKTEKIFGYIVAFQRIPGTILINKTPQGYALRRILKCGGYFLG